MSTFSDNEDIIKAAFNAYLPQLSDCLKEEGEQGLIDSIHEFTTEALKAPEIVNAISCHKGCGFCCFDEILCTSIEGRNIKKYIDQNKITYDQSLLKRQKKGYADLKYKHKKCGFLDTDMTCKIYPVRPMICRTHNATTPPEVCDKSKGVTTTREVKTAEVEGINMGLVWIDNQGRGMTNLASQLWKLTGG